MKKMRHVEEGLLFPVEEEKQFPMKEKRPVVSSQIPVEAEKIDRRRKPAIYEPRPELTMQEMREFLMGLKDIESVKGIRYVKLHVTARMIIGIREASGKEFTINLDELYCAYQKCLRFTSPEVKKYIFMGHSPAVVLLRMLQNRK